MSDWLIRFPTHERAQAFMDRCSHYEMENHYWQGDDSQEPTEVLLENVEVEGDVDPAPFGGVVVEVLK